MPIHQSPDDFAQVNLSISAPASPIASEVSSDQTSNSRFPRGAIIEEQQVFNQVLHLAPFS